MPRSKSIKAEVLRLIRARPFQRFVLILESGDRALIEHPENIAFDPTSKDPSRDQFSVITVRIHLDSTFDAVSGIALADREGAAA